MPVFKTMCARDCPDSCFMNAEVENDKLISVKPGNENPYTGGFLCSRGNCDPARVYSTGRVLYPRRNDNGKPGSSASKISWNGALDEICSKLSETIARRGPESVLLLDFGGNAGLITSLFPRRLWNAIGAAETDYSLCGSSGHKAIGLHYGLSYGLSPEKLAEKKCVIFWGCNPLVSASHLWAQAQNAKKNNSAKIVVIDTRKSESAEKSDLWIDPRPGTDAALAYAIARTLIERDLVDMEFIRKRTAGFEEFRNEAMKWTRERVEGVTGIGPDRVEKLVELIKLNGPAAFIIGIGFQKSFNGACAVRAVSLLPAMLGTNRGFFYTNSRGRFVNFEKLTRPELRQKPARVVSMVDIGRSLEAGEFGFIWISGMNPAMTLPGQNAVRKGLSRNDAFVTTHDTHMSETCDFSNIVLPAPTFFEKNDIILSDAHNLTRLAKKAIEPLGESREETVVIREIAKRLGLFGQWINEEPMAAAALALESAFEKGSFQDLMNGDTMRLRERGPDEYQTSSGRIEFLASGISEGVSPIPLQNDIEKTADEFILLNSANARYLHSQFQDIHGPVPAIVWINSKDAARLGICDEEITNIYNELNDISLKAVVTDKIPPGTLWSSRPVKDGNEKVLNALASGDPQKIGGGPQFNSIRVKIRRTIILNQ